VNVKAIPIELIRLDGGTQIRACSTFQTKVEDYAIAMTQDADFPPLTVFWDGADYWLADGFHRHGAYNFIMQTLGLPGMNLPCEVLEGTQRDAILYACSANSAHGMPRTVPDKQNAVRTMLKNPLVALNEDGVPWTDRQIGRICNVDHKMVGRHRADLAAEAAKSQNSDNGHLGHAPDSGAARRHARRHDLHDEHHQHRHQYRAIGGEDADRRGGAGEGRTGEAGARPAAGSPRDQARRAWR
jgi:hypothetical protein